MSNIINNKNEVKWTASQKKAIEYRGGSLLVSAAAGSGKTAVLTERIISRVTDKKAPADISRILTVTFTKSAAAELKEKITAALNKAIAAHPGDTRLARQLLRLNRAKICTIDSFCSGVVKSNFNKLRLNANMRIVDKAELELIKYEVMNRVIELFYDSPEGIGTISNFEDFIENFVSVKDDRFIEGFISLYDKLRSYPDGVEFIKKCAEDLNGAAGVDFFKTKWGQTFRQATARKLDYYRKAYAMALDYMSDDIYEKYKKAFEYDMEYIECLLDAVNGENYDLSREVLNSYEKQTLQGRISKENTTDELELYKSVRTDFREEPEKLKRKFFGIGSGKIAETIKKTSDLTSQIYSFMTFYEERLNAEKRRRNVLDFADLEQLTHKLFYKDGKLTDEAYAVRADYDEVYIDEYQDVNRLQDEIFRAVAKPGGSFMVGDIKQSIYSFRGANPNIFAEYRSGKAGGFETVYLSENFRSDPPIIKFTNTVMSRLFRNNSGRVEYTDFDDLVYSKAQSGRCGDFQKVEVALIEYGENADAKAAEAEYVCTRIKELLDAGYERKDITLLFRSLKNSKIYEEALSRLKIPYFVNVSAGFFENAEILLMLCLLNVIDNPSKDIYLAGLLKSPMFAFTLDELVEIKTEFKKGSLYDSLKDYTAEHGFAKGADFLAKLDGYRDYADGQPVDKLLWRLYQETGILAYVFADNGCKDISAGIKLKNEERYANLLMLYDYARQYENGSFKGLYNFILYITDIINQNETVGGAKIFEEAGDTVKLMTIHQSKGLQFKVCFLCETSAKLNKTDTSKNVLLDEDLGFTMKLRDDTGYAYYDTPIRQASVLQIEDNLIDDEMRVLYVALTRSMEKLIITAGAKNADKLMKDCERGAAFISPHVFTSNPVYIEWILTALADNGPDESYKINIIYDYDSVITNGAGAAAVSETPDGTENSADREDAETEAYFKLFKERFDYKYPYSDIMKLPAKISVSDLHRKKSREEAGADTDMTVTEVSALTQGRMPEHSPCVYKKPKFLEPDPKKITPAERGTATHVFMQFCDFAYINGHGIEAEIMRLTEEKFISPSDALIINKTQLKRFFGGALYKRMLKADKIWRETRFNLDLPVRDGEYILVQGVIDCFFLESGKLVLTDYKTDSFFIQTDEDREEARRVLRERHKEQLAYYKTACEKLTGYKVGECCIYSFALGETIEINIY